MSGPVDVLLASDAEHAHDLGGEGRPLLHALRAAGLSAQVAVWDDPEEDWGRARLVVVRSVWDSHRRREEVLGWARAVTAAGADLRNPAHVLAENTHKAYLRGLVDRGVPVVPTVWVPPGGTCDAPALRQSLGEDVVVKPAVSAGAERTTRSGPEEAARAATALARGGETVMVQPYLRSADDPGETKVVVLGGAVSHAVRTMPMLARDPGGRLSPDASPDAHVAREPSPDELAVVEQVLGALPYRDELLYARVDLLRDDDGRPLLAELELAEPRLFVEASDEAPRRFAAACAAVL